MGRRRSDDEIDWKSVFLSYFSHDGAVGASSDAPALVDEDGEPYFRRRRPTAKAPVGLGSDAPPASKDHVGLGPDVPPPASNKDPVGLGLDVSPASKDVYDFSPMDEDEQGEQHVSPKHCLELSPKPSGQKKNDGQLPMNKGKSQGSGGGKRKPSANKGRARTNDPEESDYESSLPSSRFSKRRKEQLQNSSSVYSQKVQDVVLLDNDEDMEPKEEVNREMSDRLNEPKIYYPSRDDQEAVELTRSDIKCLNPEVFLSSQVINFYIKYIKRTRLCNENFRGKFYIFNTYFFGKLEEALRQPRDFPKLRRWWKGVNIFNNTYIILPIHAREHWSLVIICLPPKERISEPIILHLDSLGMHRSTKILNTVGRYLEREWDFLSVAEAAWPCLLNDIRKKAVQVPQQNNAYDCGIFMLYYIEQFIKEAPARFTTDKLGMFNRSWFKPEEASGLRHRIRELLLEEFESAKLNEAILKADASKRYDNIKDGELEADDNSKMVVEVGVRLGNTVESNGGMKVAASKDLASGESGDVVKSTRGIKVAASQEASEESRDADKRIEGMKVAASEEASREPEDTVKSTGGIKVAASQEASEESRDAGKIIDEMKVAASEEASGKSGDVVKNTGGIKVVASQEASEKSRDAGKSIEEMELAISEEASEESGDAIKSTGGIKVAISQEASQESRDVGKSIEGMEVAVSEVASEESRDAVKSTGGIKVLASQEASEESQNAGKSIKGINVAESEETGEVSRDTAKSIKGISVAQSNEASGEPGDTGNKTNKGIKVTASEADDIEFGYAASMEDNADVALQNKGPTSNTKCNKNNAGYVLSKAAACSHSVKDDKKGTAKSYSSSSKAEKQGESIAIASPKRLKGTEEAMGSTPVPDAASDSGVKRSEGNEEVTGSMPIPDAVYEASGTKVWVTRIYRRTSGTTLEPGNWCWSIGGSSKNARRSFIEHFSRKK